MKEYELLYVVGGDETEETSLQVTDEVNALLMKMGGKVEREDAWGRKRLAYEIAKQNYGWYTVARFSLDAEKVEEFDTQLRLNEKVIRYMLVRADELPTEEEAAKLDSQLQSSSRDAREVREPRKPAAKPEPRKPETDEEKAERQSKLDSKLGEILSEE